MKIADPYARLFQPGLITEIPTGRLVWVDSVYGVDDLAVRERMSVPFKTLTAAKLAAASGDTIIVLPGTYAEKNLLKTGVNWHFMPGSKVEYSGAADGAIFDTGPFGAADVITSVVTGQGDFSMLTYNSNSHVVNTSASGAGGSNLLIQGRSIYANGTAVKLGDPNGNARCSIHFIDDIVSNSGDSIIVSGGIGRNFVHARDIRTSGGCALNVTAGNIDLTAYKISASADSGVKVTGGTGIITVRSYEISSPSKSAVYYAASTNPILNLVGTRLVSTGTVAADSCGVRIGTDSPDKVRLFNCVIIVPAVANGSIWYSCTGTNPRVHLYSHAVANKDEFNINIDPGRLLFEEFLS